MAATATITADQVGAYELALTAGTEVTVDVSPRSVFASPGLEVTVHSGNSPVYFRTGDTAVAAKDPTAQMALAGSSLILPVGWGSGVATVRLVSAAAAVVSVART